MSAAPGSIVITPESRGPDGFNDGLAGADVFEVWADVAAHYRLNPRWTVITGYSMGGMGTFKLAEEFPDLFAKAQPTVGYSAVNALVPSLRNIPFLMWNMATDELVPPASYGPTALALDSAGYRYELDVYSPGEHLTLAINDQYAPAAAFLGTTMVNRNPVARDLRHRPGSRLPGVRLRRRPRLLGLRADRSHGDHDGHHRRRVARVSATATRRPRRPSTARAR